MAFKRIGDWLVVHRFIGGVCTVFALTAFGAGSSLAFTEAEGRAKLATMGTNYEPRTEHFRADGQPTYVNRLINETSPYLIQHAHNPVNWYPWGEEAFAAARAQDKPVFLSIGYSTCHWCHVMEKESFEDEDIAAQMNADYISIKVDREERPDVDQIYMTAVQLMEQRGGWPLSGFLTDDGKPFYAGTYFPPEQFSALLDQVDGAWEGKRPDLLIYGANVQRAINGYLLSTQKAGELSPEIPQTVFGDIIERIDPFLGGTDGAPKFPQEPMWRLAAAVIPTLPDANNRTELLQALSTTLNGIQAGGIRDHLGGGFHRYSTDRQWLLPHFEKMLYNQAQLSMLFLDTYWLTGNLDFLDTAQDTLDYVAREMTAANGLFYSATDADSRTPDGELEEGVFFVWDSAEIDALFGAEDAARIKQLYGVKEDGNWRSEQGQFESTNILHLDGVPSVEDRAFLASVRKTMRDHREASRVAPLLDNKSIVAWNGWMIEAFVQAAQMVPNLADRDRYSAIATKALDGLVDLHWNAGEQQLYRVSMDGVRGGIQGKVDDYASLIQAILAVHDLRPDAGALDLAQQLGRLMIEQFVADGAVYMVADNRSDLIIRPLETYDGATPSGRSAAFSALVALFERTGALEWEEATNELLGAMAGNLNENPIAAATATQAALRFVSRDRHSVPGVPLSSGMVQASLQRSEDQVTVSLDVASGWHINSAAPLNSDYIATQVSGLNGVGYPKGKLASFGFSQEELSVYDGKTQLTGTVQPGRHWIELDVQACNDEICLPPEQVSLFLPFSLADSQ